MSPRFNPISIAGAHVRDAGCTAAEEMAYTLANGLAYVDELQAPRRRCREVRQARCRSSSTCTWTSSTRSRSSAPSRRLWAKLHEGALRRAGTRRRSTSASAWSAAARRWSRRSPYNNVVRVAVETMAAVLGGAQSIFTCAFDEAFQIPTETSAELAVRTQQIIAYESGIGAPSTRWAAATSSSSIPIAWKSAIERRDATRSTTTAASSARSRTAGSRCGLPSAGASASTRSIPARAVDRRAEPLPAARARRTAVGEVFKLDPTVARRVLENSSGCSIRAARRTSTSSWRGLQKPLRNDRENLMPYLVDCCHAYATVGEMVGDARRRSGANSRSPSGL